MGIRFRCHHCEYELHVKDYQGGRRGKCPKCQGTFRIPTEDAAHSLAVESRNQPAAAAKSAGKQERIPHKQPDQRMSAPTAAAAIEAAPAGTRRSRPSSAPSGPTDVSTQQRQPRSAVPEGRTRASSATTGESSHGNSHVESPHPTSSGQVDTLEQDEMAKRPQEFTTEGRLDASTSANAPAAASGGPASTHSGDIQAIVEAPAAQWYVRPTSGGQFGPVAGELFRQWLQENRVAKDSLVWREGWPEWQLAESALPEYFGPQTEPPAPVSVPASSPPPPPTAESASSGSAAAVQETTGATPALLIRKKRRKRNYVVMLVVLSVLALVLLTALITAIVLQQTPSS